MTALGPAGALYTCMPAQLSRLEAQVADLATEVKEQGAIGGSLELFLII